MDDDGGGGFSSWRKSIGALSRPLFVVGEGPDGRGGRGGGAQTAIVIVSLMPSMCCGRPLSDDLFRSFVVAVVVHANQHQHQHPP
mmetsp:Transcript_49804/g.50637  ORF Transcript_49804/g.50637 Transcript_49804/m.50637 type:complete len:85 (-) Transcript_49804:89-343(-)